MSGSAKFIWLMRRSLWKSCANYARLSRLFRGPGQIEYFDIIGSEIITEGRYFVVGAWAAYAVIQVEKPESVGITFERVYLS